MIVAAALLLLAWQVLPAGSPKVQVLPPGSPRVQRLVQTLPVEAANFVKVAPTLVSRETIRYKDASRNPKKPVEHEVVSDYSFVQLQDASGAIREVRRVASVDGKPAKQDSALDAIAAAYAGGSEQEKRKQLEQLSKYGLESTATDIGQLLLLFSQSSIDNYEFNYTGDKTTPRGRVLMFSYAQLDGPGGMRVFGGGKEVRKPRLKGQIWMSEVYFRPVYVSLETAAEPSKGKNSAASRQEIAVEYAKHPAGCAMPVSATHRELVESTLRIENRYTYEPFRPLREETK